MTLNWRFVSKDRAIHASFYSFLASLISFVVLYDILRRLDSERSITAIVVYSLGIAAGTFLGTKLKIGSKENN